MGSEGDDENKAEARTDLAEDRTVQATERTYYGSLRTSFGAIAVAIGLQAFFGDFEPPWLARGIATFFLLLAAAIAFSANRSARDAMDRLTAHKVESATTPWIRWTSWSVISGSLLLVIAIWILK